MEENFDLINLTVGGKKFVTYYDTLKQSAYFQELIQNHVGTQAIFIEDEEGQYFFIDRDGDIFEDVLHYLRSCEIRQRSQEQLRKLEHEATFYGFDELKAKANQAFHDWLLDKEYDFEFHVEGVNDTYVSVGASFSGNLANTNNNSIVASKIKYQKDIGTSAFKTIFKTIKKK